MEEVSKKTCTRGKVNEERLKGLLCSLVGETEFPVRWELIWEHLELENIGVIKLIALQKNKFILEFGNKDEADIALNGSQVLFNLFSKIKKWSWTDCPEKRFVWLEVCGLPPQGWCLENFKDIARKWGKLVGFDRDIVDPKNMESIKMLVLTQNMRSIVDDVLLDLDSTSFRVWVEEVEEPELDQLFKADSFESRENEVLLSENEEGEFGEETVHSKPWNKDHVDNKSMNTANMDCVEETQQNSTSHGSFGDVHFKPCNEEHEEDQSTSNTNMDFVTESQQNSYVHGSFVDFDHDLGGQQKILEDEVQEKEKNKEIPSAAGSGKDGQSINYSPLGPAEELFMVNQPTLENHNNKEGTQLNDSIGILNSPNTITANYEFINSNIHVGSGSKKTKVKILPRRSFVHINQENTSSETTSGTRKKLEQNVQQDLENRKRAAQPNLHQNRCNKFMRVEQLSDRQPKYPSSESSAESERETADKAMYFGSRVGVKVIGSKVGARKRITRTLKKNRRHLSPITSISGSF